MKHSRPWGFILITLIYLAATAVALYVFGCLGSSHLYIRILLADIAATLVVFAAGTALNNTSVYDPYWSVAPLVILLGMVQYHHRFDAGAALLLLVVSFWGIRLTANWAHTFRNLHTQDWRYDKLQRRFPALFPLISLFGLMLMPTLVVYLAVLPGVAFLEHSTINAVTVFGALICLGATVLQLVSDQQMHAFRSTNTDPTRLMRNGLWKHARHPNYLGEILMWWGVYVILLSALPDQPILGVGALINTCLFLFISIPLADNRYCTEKAGFEGYMAETRALLPIPKR